MGIRRTVDVLALTEREREVARLMAKGRTNPQIAEDLGITFNTAKWHVSQVIAKLGVATREEAVAAWKVDQSATARLHRAIAGAATVGGLKTAGAAGGVALVVGAAIAGISTITTSGNNLVNGVIVAAVETPTPTPTPTATPSAPEGCPGGPGTIRLPLEPCPPEYFPGLEDARASGVCDLSGRDIAANLWNVDLRDCNLAGVNLASAAANNAHFDRADLKGADLHGGSFADSSFEGANLTGTNLAPAIFQGANLRGANLEGAIIRDTHFGGARWGNTVCPDGTNSDDPANGGTCIGTAGIVVVPYVFGGETVARTPETPFLATELRALDRGSCNFDGEDLAGLNLLRLNLPGCSFAAASLAGIEVRGTSLGGSNLRGANIEGTRFRSVDLTDAILQGATGLPVFEYVKWENTICPDGSNSRVMDGDDQTCESNLIPAATGD